MKLRITNGNTTIDLNDAINYGVVADGWTPTVARRRVSQLIGSELYENVLEEIPLHVRAEKSGSALINLGALSQLLDQVEQWQIGEATAVWLEYQPTNSAITWWATITANHTGALLALSPRVNAATNNEIDGITLRVERRGQWLKSGTTIPVLNPSFEHFTDDLPDDWENIDLGEGQITQVTSPVYSGTYAILLGPGLLSDSMLAQYIDLPAALRVLVTARVRAKVGAATMRVQSGDAGYVDVSTTSINVWELLAIETTAGYIADKASYGIGIQFLRGTPHSSTEFYVDSVEAYALDHMPQTASGITNGNVAQVSISPEPLPCPTKIVIEGMKVGLNHLAGFIAVGNRANSITVMAAEQLAVLWGAGFTSVSDTSAYARNNSVLRYTPSNTVERGGEISSSGAGRRFAVFANVRNNSSSTTFSLRVYVQRPDATEYNMPVEIASQPNRPQWVSLGEIACTPPTSIGLGIQASAASGTLDIDTIVYVNLDDGMSYVVRVGGANTGATLGNSAGERVVVDPRILTGLQPEVTAVDGGDSSNWPARGGLSLYTDGHVLEVLVMSCGSDSTRNTWRQVASSSPIDNDISIIRLSGQVIAR